MRTDIVTIDGPAGAGKSTVARRVADLLGWMYLDTGAMYRAVTWTALKKNANWEDEAALLALIRAIYLDVRADSCGMRVLVDGDDVSDFIRRPEVTNQIFHIANSASLRSVIVEWQQQIGRHQALVAEGRDVGSVVFPEARFKFYLDADPRERARRRWLELKANGQNVDLEELSADIRLRDERDMSRAVSPLVKPVDATRIDCSHLSPEEVAKKIITVIKNHE